MELRSGADVRRERADPVVQLAGRPRPIELAVGGPDLLGVRHSALLRTEVLGLERRIDKIRCHRCGSLEHGARIVFRSDWEPALRPDRAGVELIYEPDARHAARGVARDD